MIRALSCGALAALAACGHASPGVTPPPAASMSLAVDLYAIRDGQRVLVHEGEHVRSGEVIELEITPSTTAFLYVVQQRPSGELDLLAPDHGDVAFSAGETVRLPPADADYELYVDDDTGVETLIVMASPRPIAELDHDAADVMVEADPAAVVEPVPEVAPPAAVEIDAGVEPARAVVKVKRKKTHPKKAAGAGRADTVDEGSISLHPRGVRKRPKRVEVEADAAGVVIYPYVFVHD